MKKITVKQIMAWGPCEEYTESRVQELIGRGKTPFEILGLNIPLQDRLWVLLHKEIIPESLLHLLACDFAEMVVHLNPDSRVQAAITAKRNWIDGEVTDEKLAREARESELILLNFSNSLVSSGNFEVTASNTDGNEAANPRPAPAIPNAGPPIENPVAPKEATLPNPEAMLEPILAPLVSVPIAPAIPSAIKGDTNDKLKARDLLRS